ncbi:hypothetical protein IQ22_00233 [Pseudomonas duriflava]|uniref:Uncharacterized protein n=1 Tax=Pseudomonas duriflava TaxID=459528 RepID=A0A562QP73_9PSED|nr:hypothetical protein IQ22_00233 [Pseudomonas duriflava]
MKGFVSARQFIKVVLEFMVDRRASGNDGAADNPGTEDQSCVI